MKNSAPLSPKDWTLKAVQMDLARQIEPLDRVLEFFDLAQRCGYNAVVLYLEDRIRTESYPYAAPGEFYTPEEIRRTNSRMAAQHASFRKSNARLLRSPAIQAGAESIIIPTEISREYKTAAVVSRARAGPSQQIRNAAKKNGSRYREFPSPIQ